MVIGRGGWGEGGKYDNVRLCDLEGPDLFSLVWTVVTWCGGFFFCFGRVTLSFFVI